MQNRGKEQHFSEQNFVHYTILRMRFCGGAALKFPQPIKVPFSQTRGFHGDRGTLKER